MCGRYTLTTPEGDLVEVFGVPALAFDWEPRYNIAPTQVVPVVAEDDEGRRMGLLRWGLVPYWADDPSIGNRMINARSETVAEKPAFREAFRRRRCLVPADGFYEWEKREGAGKVPHWIHRADRRPFAFAGLWERWRAPEGDPLHTFTILTTEASPSLRRIHPRMPVILPEAGWSTWLDREADGETLLELLRPFPDGELSEHPVSTRVNTPAEDDAGLVEPAEP